MGVLLINSSSPPRLNLRAICQTLPVVIASEMALDFQTVAQIAKLKPNFILWHTERWGDTDLSLARQMTQVAPASNIILVIQEADESQMQETLRAGVRGYIPTETITVEGLAAAIRVVTAGGIFFDSQTGARLLQSLISRQ